MSLTPQEKDIYNLHLKTSRSFSNTPWRPRKNFDKIDPLKVTYLKKIYNITSTKNIEPEIYISAPYELWKEENKYYDLEYFTTFKAIKAYNLLINKLLFEEPENKIIVNMVKSGFMHIYNICKSRGLKSIEEYFFQKDYYPLFITDLKERFITYYNILGINNYDQLLKNYSKEDIEFIITDYYNIINTLRVRYYKADKLKKLNNEIINKLNKILKNKI